MYQLSISIYPISAFQEFEVNNDELHHTVETVTLEVNKQSL